MIAEVEPSYVTTAWWRWGESNPRPSLRYCVFSGRSLCRRSARLRPLSQTPKSTSPAWEESRVTSRRRHTARSLDDARSRVGITHGLTDYRARLRSEGEVIAICIGNYVFAEIVFEITLHPRPASRRFAGDVETDHPRALEIEVSSLRRAVVTLLSFQTGCHGIRAHQTTTDPRHPEFPVPASSPIPCGREQKELDDPRRSHRGGHPRRGCLLGPGRFAGRTRGSSHAHAYASAN